MRLLLIMLGFIFLGSKVSQAQGIWRLGVNYNLGFSYRNVNYTGSVFETFAKADNALFQPRFSQGMGLFVENQKSKRWSFQTGIQYIVRGSKIPSGKLTFSDMLTDSNGHRIPNPPPSIPVKEDIFYAFRYLQLPIYATYYPIIHKKQKVMITIGSSVDLLLHGYSIIRRQVEGEKMMVQTYMQPDSLFHKINFSLYLSAGYEYQVSKKISIRVSPFYSVNLRYMEQFKYYRGRYYNYGIGLTCIYTPAKKIKSRCTMQRLLDTF